MATTIMAVKNFRMVVHHSITLFLLCTLATPAWAGACCGDKEGVKGTASCCKSTAGGAKSACCAKDKKTGDKDEKTITKVALIQPPATPLNAEQLLPPGHDRPFAEIEIQHRARNQMGMYDSVPWLQSRLIGQGKMPLTGATVAGAKQFDETLALFMKHWAIPGATVAVSKNGKLLYSRGFGYADINTRAKMPPDTLFRIASISKAVTAIAVLKLCEQGKISLNSPFLPLLKLNLPKGTTLDPELKKVTVSQLLQCTGGWDRKKSGDPMFQPLAREAAQEYGYTLRPTRTSIIQYWLGRKLDSLPGTHFHYSNFSYALVFKKMSPCAGRELQQNAKE